MPKEQDEVTKYIQSELKAGRSQAEVVGALVASGWQQDAAQTVVSQAAGVPMPPSGSAAPAPPNTTSQTGNAGTPLQVENVQYNMTMAPVESRVGFFLKIASVGLWFMAFFVAVTLATLIAKADDSSIEVAGVIVFTVSLSVAALPTFFIANKKMEEEFAKNPAQVDDLFFKKATRSGLYGAVVLTAISVISAVYNLLASAFLEDGGSVTGFFQAFAFVIGFGAVMAYFWRLHGRTKR